MKKLNRIILNGIFFSIIFVSLGIFWAYSSTRIILLKNTQEQKALENVNTTESGKTEKYEDALKAIQEVAYAYYMRGKNIQYNPHKYVYGVYSPEEATSQNLNYACCSHFEKNIYYDSFGIMIPQSCDDKLKYGKDNLGKPEVIAYRNKK